jgi:hypothetical protein
VVVPRSLVAVALAACGRIGFGELAPDTAPGPNLPGLVARYPMDGDFPGTVAADPPSFSGTCTNCPTPTAGVFAGAAAFDSTQYASVPAALLDNQPYTVSVWASFGASSEYHQPVLGKSITLASALDTFYLWFMPSSGNMVFETSSGTGVDGMGTPAMNLVGWHHYAASWDGTTKRLYVDGVLGAMAATTIVSSTEPIYIGTDADNGAVTDELTGALDELRVYDHALSDGEVAELAVQ